MAGEDRATSSAIVEGLAKRPQRFDFFQALRLLECVAPDRPRLGTSRRAHQDGVRLTQQPTVAFQPSSIAAFQTKDGGRHHLEVLLFGLFGPHGPLPLHLTVHALERQRQHYDPTFKEFCDLFHHRLLSLFYRAWADANPHVDADRQGIGQFALFVGSLMGLGASSQHDRDHLVDSFKFHHAGLASQQVRTPEAIASMARNLTGYGARIIEFIGGWLELPEPIRCRLGHSPDTGLLGQNVVIGSRSWQRMHRFRLRLGPMDYFGFRQLLPGGTALERLRSMMRLLVGEQFDWQLQLVLKHQEIPELTLDGSCNLGWNCWLPKQDRQHDSDDLILGPAPAAA